MPSIIEGYSYDIFISYRQNDNKYDGWVTEFVDNLNKELEANIKDKVSVYFDINPTDGLLETDSVDKSLENKLKCLIFMPIISRTYCDPKSYAWQHEFCAFNKLAKEDRFGRDIRLSSGNVGSRILPVQIHDLDADDKKLIENELGGFIRGIEFIYKEPGVNRPLRSNEDNPENNLNKTYYRNQINKVANAVKEIITALKKQSQHTEEAAKEDLKVKSEDKKNLKTKLILGSVLPLVLIVLGFFFAPKLLKSSGEIEKSIAVLPFINDSPSDSNQYFINGIMEEVLNNLMKIKDFRVLSRTSTDQYKGRDRPTIPEIAKKLDVNYIVEGSGQKIGNTFILRVQLIAAEKKEKHLWADRYEQEIKDVKDYIRIQSQVAQSIAAELKATITPEEKQLIEKVPTTNLTAYEFYQKGKEEIVKYWMDNNDIDALRRAEVFYKKALTIDSTFANVYSGLALIYRFKYNFNITSSRAESYLDSILVLSKKALLNDNQCAEAYYASGLYYFESGNFDAALKDFDKALKFNPNYWEVYAEKGGSIYANWDYNNVDYIKAFENIIKAASINHGQELPILIRDIGNGLTLYCGLEKGYEYFQKALELDGDTNLYLNNLANSEWNFGYREKSLELLHNLYKKDSTNIDVLHKLGYNNEVLGQDKEAFKYFKKYAKRIEETGNIERGALHRIGYAYWQNGYRKGAQHYFDEQIKSYEKTIKESRRFIGNAYYDLAGIYAFTGKKDKAYQYLKQWATIPVPPFWWIVLVKEDPLFNSIRNEPEFQQIVRYVEAKYQAEHERVKKWLEENNML